MSETEEIAKAIQETAKLGEKGLDIADKLGNFLTKVFKEPISEIAGIVTDKLRFIRWKNLVEISEKVSKILEDKGVTKTRSIPMKLAFPIIQEATLEDDEDIKMLWSHLLSNALDPNFNDELRYGFIDMIKNITGIEAKIILYFYEILLKENKLTPLSDIYKYWMKKEMIIESLDISLDVYAISVNNLMRMQLISPAILTGGISMGNEPITIFKGIDAITFTPLGVKFVEACVK